MNLHSGLPYWLVLNGLADDFPPLTESLLSEEIVIIGSGISGALVANELCKSGFRCTMIDRRMISTGSTVASTSHLNYELDVSFEKLIEDYGEENAVTIYQSNLSSVKRVGEVLKHCGVDAGYENKGSLYLASDKKGVREIEEEYRLRVKHHFQADIINESELKSIYGIDRAVALHHNDAAQLDAYLASTGLILHNVKAGNLSVYTRTEIEKIQSDSKGVVMQTKSGHMIKAKHVVCAPGYESAMFLPKKVMKIASTYALVTQPFAKEVLWKDQPLIWETARPYFYVRSTSEGRIMMGGLDEPFKNETVRDLLLEKKKAKLVENCKELFPHLDNIQIDFAWCGSFAETENGLPFIGEYPGLQGISFALGYGGNGITYSMIAAEMICNQLKGIRDDRSELFSFDR